MCLCGDDFMDFSLTSRSRAHLSAWLTRAHGFSLAAQAHDCTAAGIRYIPRSELHPICRAGALFLSLPVEPTREDSEQSIQACSMIKTRRANKRMQEQRRRWQDRRSRKGQMTSEHAATRLCSCLVVWLSKSERNTYGCRKGTVLGFDEVSRS